MKWFHWLAVLGVFYFVANGAVTFYNTYGGGDVQFPLPDWGTAGVASPQIAGSLDLGTAAAIYFFVLHKKLMG
jgi:hypothetical protein